MAVRRGCGLLAKAQAIARVDVPTAPRQCCVFFCFEQLDVVSLPIVETQKSRRNVIGVDRRETGLLLRENNDVIVWGSWSLRSSPVCTFPW